ncbi:MAG: hypothetical protein ACRDAM_21950, partial [Casimicrobium sp.]
QKLADATRMAGEDSSDEEHEQASAAMMEFLMLKPCVDLLSDVIAITDMDADAHPVIGWRCRRNDNDAYLIQSESVGAYAHIKMAISIAHNWELRNRDHNPRQLKTLMSVHDARSLAESHA